MTEIDLRLVRKFSNIEFLAKNQVEGFITGLHKSPYHGFSVEFAEHKIYNTGESTRHIDWKLYAKTDRLYTKRYEEETNLRCNILIDVSGSMFYPSETKGKLTFAAFAAACICYLLQKQRDAFGITTFSDRIEDQTPIKSNSLHAHKIFIGLQRLIDKEAPQSSTSKASEILHLIAEQMNKRSLVVLFSDLFESEDLEQLYPALQHLKHNKHEVIIFQVTDKKTEKEFSFENRPYEFIDLESGEKIKLNANEVKDFYTQNVTKFYTEVKERCRQYGIDFVEADINEGVEQVLMTFLSKRAKMK